MAQLNQLVGIIELDADPNLDAPADENIGQTLRRLRTGAARSAADVPFCAAGLSWQPAGASAGSVVVIAADLRQLHCDLECEWAELLDQLLWLDN